jgi:hypothetical protein
MKIHLPRHLPPAIAGAAVLIVAGALIAAHRGGGDPYGRGFKQNYFSGAATNYVDWAFVPTPSITYTGLGPGCEIVGNSCNMNEARFFQTYQDRLFDPSGGAPGFMDQGRAAAEIDIMLGVAGPTFNAGTQAQSTRLGIAYAKAHFQQWKNLIDIYAKGLVPGYRVQWNDYIHFCGSGDPTCPIPDTNGFGASLAPNGPIGTCPARTQCLGDISFLNNFNDDGFDFAVNFVGGGKRFIIKHKCGNLTGDLGSLVLPSSTINITKTSSHPAPMPVGTIMTYTIDPKEVADIPMQTVTIHDTIPAQFKYLGPAPGTPAPTAVGNNLTWTFNQPADAVILNQIALNGRNLSVIVQAIAIGSGIVNTATGTSVDEFGTPLTVNPGSTTNDIIPIDFPSVQAFNSDVHAGGGTCNQAVFNNGQLQGNPQGSSGVQYVASANAVAGITNFQSGGGAGGGQTLNLGKNGSYAAVCRQDIVAYAKSNPTANAVTIGGPAFGPGIISNFDLSVWTNPATPGASSVYFYDGAADAKGLPILHISGTILQKTTIVALAGTVEIDGDITITPANFPVDQLPSLGIAADGNISISAAATRVDAYLFSNSIIDTCFQGTASNSACLGPPLVVNGFFMSNQLLLHRLGPANANGAVVAEQVSLNPQIYLNPPVYFDSSVDSISQYGLHEGRPLF